MTPSPAPSVEAYSRGRGGAPTIVLEREGPGGLRVHSEVASDRWDAYVARHPEASTYHVGAWPRLIADVFGHRFRLLVAERDRCIVGALPLVFFQTWLLGRPVVSMPFVNYGGVLADSPEIANALLHAATAEAGAAGASYLELRHTRQQFNFLPSKRHKVVMLAPLERSREQQWQALGRKVRNHVRKAERCGLEVRQGHLDLLAPFYRVFTRNMRDLGTPTYGIEFFAEVLKALPSQSRVFCVFTKDRPIAASIVVWSRGKLEVPWASSVRPFNHLCPNTLLYWSMFAFGVAERFGQFDLGRCTPDSGTYRFKRSWGGQPRPVVWEYWVARPGQLPNRSPTNARLAPAIALWKRLPVRVATLLGPRVVRAIP